MTRVKRTISLPQALVAQAEEWARLEGKTLSAVIEDALRGSRARRLEDQFRAAQGFWSSIAKAKGILTEEDLERYLRE